MSHALHEYCGYDVLALECDEKRTHGAETRAQKLGKTNHSQDQIVTDHPPDIFETVVG